MFVISNRSNHFPSHVQADLSAPVLQMRKQAQREKTDCLQGAISVDVDRWMWKTQRHLLCLLCYVISQPPGPLCFLPSFISSFRLLNTSSHIPCMLPTACCFGIPPSLALGLLSTNLSSSWEASYSENSCLCPAREPWTAPKTCLPK